MPLKVSSNGVNVAACYLQDRVAKEGQYAGDEAAARKLAEELGFLPLALEQAAAFIIELRWSFDKYREGLRKLLDRHREGATRYPASVAKTWNITLERLNPIARALLRFAAWFGPDAIPRGIFSAGPTILSESLGESIEDLDLAIEEALGELARFSLIRLSRFIAVRWPSMKRAWVPTIPTSPLSSTTWPNYSRPSNGLGGLGGRDWPGPCSICSAFS